MASHTDRLPQSHTQATPTSFFVLGLGEGAHWTALALMACLQAQGLRLTAFMPLAHDAQWHQGQWHSARLLRLQAASSFDFPAYAMCAAPVPDPAAKNSLTLDAEAVVDSYAALATWADLVVIDGEGGPDAPLAPGVTVGTVAQELGLPALLVCEGSGTAAPAPCDLVSRCHAHGIRVVGCVQVGEGACACVTGLPRLGAIPLHALRDAGVAAGYVDAQRLVDVLC